MQMQHIKASKLSTERDLKWTKSNKPKWAKWTSKRSDIQVLYESIQNRESWQHRL